MDERQKSKFGKRIAKLRRRSNNIRSRELKALALSMGRIPKNTGKHPTFEGGPPGTFPISIPDHPGTLKRFTAENILDVLERDLE